MSKERCTRRSWLLQLWELLDKAQDSVSCGNIVQEGKLLSIGGVPSGGSHSAVQVFWPNQSHPDHLGISLYIHGIGLLITCIHTFTPSSTYTVPCLADWQRAVLSPTWRKDILIPCINLGSWMRSCGQPVLPSTAPCLTFHWSYLSPRIQGILYFLLYLVHPIYL